MHYFRGLASALVPKNPFTWFGVLLLFALGANAVSEWPIYRDAINSRQNVVVMPDALTVWHALTVFLLLTVLRLAHMESMRHLKAARVQFGEPYVRHSVNLYEGDFNQPAGRRLMGQNDIACIAIGNTPYDGATGRDIQHCAVGVELFDLISHRRVLSFDYPRWNANQKPGYPGSPSPPVHFPDEWNRRLLPASGEETELNFLVKSIGDDHAYGFRGRSQLLPLWHDPELVIAAGQYAVRITVRGVGLRTPAEQWLKLEIGAAGCSIDLRKIKAISVRRSH